MTIFYDSKIPALLGAEGVTFCDFIFIKYSKEKCPDWLLAHEKYHVKQQKDLYYVGMWALYAWDYIKGRLKGLDHYNAYLAVRYEVDAYSLHNKDTVCSSSVVKESN